MKQVTSLKPDLLFDVDGVLVHPQLQFREYLTRNHGITPEMTAPFFRGRFMACATGQAELSDELGVFLDQWGWKGTVSSFIETWLREDDKLDDTMLKLVANLRVQGHNCHVASVQERNRAAYLQQFRGFDEIFDQTFFSCDIGSAKPDPAFYLKAQAKLARPPHELLLVDDSLACVRAARNAGWQAFHYKGPSDQADLITVIRGLNTL
jgi:HAD superfamily hydrolase (TIGR01509 family)